MSVVGFFTLSGVLTWGWLIWRVARLCAGQYRRLKWAFSGYRQPRRYSR